MVKKTNKVSPENTPPLGPGNSEDVIFMNSQNIQKPSQEKDFSASADIPQDKEKSLSETQETGELPVSEQGGAPKSMDLALFEELNFTIQRLTQENIYLKAQAKNASFGAPTDLFREIEALRKENKDFQSQANQYQASAALVNELSGKIRILTEENADLQKKLRENTATVQLDVLRKENEDLRVQLSKSQSLVTQIDLLKKENSSLVEGGLASRSQISSLEGKVKELSLQLNEAALNNQKVAALTQENTSLKNEISQAQGKAGQDSANELLALQKENEELKNKLAQQDTSSLEELNRKVAALTQENTSLKDQVGVLSSDKQKLEVALQERQGLEEKIRLTEEQLKLKSSEFEETDVEKRKIEEELKHTVPTRTIFSALVIFFICVFTLFFLLFR